MSELPSLKKRMVGYVFLERLLVLRKSRVEAMQAEQSGRVMNRIRGMSFSGVSINADEKSGKELPSSREDAYAFSRSILVKASSLRILEESMPVLPVVPAESASDFESFPL